REDARLQFPSREIRLARIDLGPQEQELTQLVRRHVGGLNPLQQTSLAQALMSSPQALAVQLENMAEGQPSLLQTGKQARALANSCSQPSKLRQLLLLCDELRASRPDWRVVVFTLRKETQWLIGQALERRGIPTGYIQGSQDRKNRQAVER